MVASIASILEDEISAHELAKETAGLTNRDVITEEELEAMTAKNAPSRRQPTGSEKETRLKIPKGLIVG